MDELPDGPAATSDLLGLMTQYRMRTEYRRVLRGVWVRSDLEPDFAMMGRAAAVAYPYGVLCGWSAAELWGNPYRPADALPEIIVPVNGRQHDGVAVRRVQLDDSQWTTVDDIRCTTLERTAIDLGRFNHREDAVAALDAMTRRHPDLPELVRSELRTWENHWGIGKAHRALAAVDRNSESPWETRMRLWLSDAGLTGFVLQWEVFGGRYRLDIAWPRFKVACEYDGEHHRDAKQHAYDVGRWNDLRTDGWILLPAVARTLTRGRDAYIAQVRHALLSRGWQPAAA
ncbi:hypothetical protein [Williamsia sp.]|uniref:hypothetical protein n=1 Tax=Williamsia sp. TaxID=1872085 RepID=UPI001A232B7C|nr:hypothetical protein [Williamsia sp.]MBJ7288840.1 hypothetical protein [Williamsia sp.]